MQHRLFWKLGLTYLLLLFLVLLAVDIYAARALRRDYLRAGFEQLDSLAQLAQSRPPRLEDAGELSAWALWMARSGARITVVADDGRVLADSSEDPGRMENHANRPEIQAAFASERGRAVRHSETLNRDLVYLALRHQPAEGRPAVLRLALPLERIDEALADIRGRLWTASFVILLLAGGTSLLFSRAFSGRVERLKQFSRRVADGDFAPLPVERGGDELMDLTQALNDTAARLDSTIRTLTEERNQSAAILRSMVEGVAVIGPGRELLFCNQAFCRTFGLEAAQCEGRPFLEVIRQSELLALIQQALAGREGVTSEVAVATVRPQTFAVTAAPVRADAITGAVVVLHDVSELRRLERVRRDFVANVSHEFKTPITVIQGFAETLLGGALEDISNRQRFLEIMRDQAARLARLTDNLLKLSEIEAGKLELETRLVTVSDLIEPCLATAQLKASQKQITLEVDCPSDLPALRGDSNRLQEALQNLLDNAVQYTPSGGRVTLRTAKVDRQVAIAVSDTGIGIPRAEQERIFERFPKFEVPFWVILLCAATMGVGTAIGGWRIIHTMGSRMTRLKPVQGFAAETGAGLCIMLASALAIPLSTTHTINTSIMGVGSLQRWTAVRWNVVGEIATAWILTFPAAAAIAWVAMRLIQIWQ